MVNVDTKRVNGLGLTYACSGFVAGILTARAICAVTGLDRYASTIYPLVLGGVILLADFVLRRFHGVVFHVEWLSLRVIGIILMIGAIAQLFV
jgi:hypothetical protein